MQPRSRYKHAIEAEIKKYEEKVSHPSIVERITGAAPTREKALDDILKNMDEHDFIFLYRAVNLAADIGDNRSDVRDAVGKKALSELYAYIAGGIELLSFISFLRAASNQEIIMTTVYGALCFVTNQFEKHFQSVIQNNDLNSGILQSIKMSIDLARMPIVSTAMTQIKKCKDVTLTDIASNVGRISTNIYHVAYSNFLFFGKSLFEKPQEEKAENRVAHANRPGQS